MTWKHETTVALANGGYQVVCAPSLSGLGDAVRQCLPGAHHGVVVVTDSHVEPLWLAEVQRELSVLRVVVLPAGESNKGWGSLLAVVDGLLDGPLRRDTPLLALGGGVVGDVGGLGAALTLRGVPVVQVPTTLLAMVDASVGGKTAINHALGKNLVGAFHQPSLVWAALETLRTLPGHELQAGYGEVIKTALVGAPDLLPEIVKAHRAFCSGNVRPIADVVQACVAVKAAVVSADERETGRRVWLNAGHTVAHGLETAMGHGALRHGHAVALGLVAELRWAVHSGVCLDTGLPERVAQLAESLGLSVRPPVFDRHAAVKAMLHDKKAETNGVAVPLVVRAGEMRVVRVPNEQLVELLDALNDRS